VQMMLGFGAVHLSSLGCGARERPAPLSNPAGRQFCVAVKRT
jgi:hypothetical protein